jgi:hypothetical protein
MRHPTTAPLVGSKFFSAGVCPKTTRDLLSSGHDGKCFDQSYALKVLHVTCRIVLTDG